jgi:hypothetical protein
MSSDTTKAARVMSAEESSCWKNGGVWISGACVHFSKAAVMRGAGCDPGPTEHLIQASLPGPLSQARAKAVNAAIRQEK